MVNFLISMQNWRTTSVGLVMIVVGLARVVGIEVDHIGAPEPLLLGGIGLLFSKDAARE